MKGFTLIEITVVIAIMSIIALLVVPTSVVRYQSYIFEECTLDVMHYLRLSHSHAKARLHGSSNGIKILPDRLVMFSGDSYLERMVVMDEEYIFPIGVTVDGLSEIVFEEITGTPSVLGILTISSGRYSSIVNISSLGLVDIL